MSRKCMVSGTKVQFGNNVSHSNRKTRRTFLPNIKDVGFWSDMLKKKVTLTVNSKGMRTIEHNGGLDNYLITTPPSRLTEVAKKLRKQVMKVKGAE